MNMSVDIGKRPCTLETQLFGLIDEYSLPEVLDRLTHLIHEQAKLCPNIPTKGLWGDVEKHLEQAVETSLTIKALDPNCGIW